MGFFRNLFKKKEPQEKAPAVVSEHSKTMEIDIRDDCIMIDGKRFELYTQIGEWSSVLGEPRTIECENTPLAAAAIDYLYPDGSVTKRVNYVWDNVGLRCFTYDGVTVRCVEIHIQPPSHDMGSAYPETQFGGVITINGQHWLPIIKRGKDTGYLRTIKVGKFELIGGYRDYNERNSKRDETSYESITVSIAEED